MERNRRPLLSHGRKRSDDELLAKLHELGFDVQRQGFVEDCRSFVSAQDMSEAMIAGADADIPAAKVDWMWIATTCLWERWQPDLPNMEMVDDKMQAGYAALAADGSVAACRLWLETWRGILDIVDRASMDSLDEFDDRFGGTQSVFNWVQDLETELHNAGLEQPQFFHERIALCAMILDRFSQGLLPIDGFKAALAQSHFELGDRQTGDRLFHAWLEELPDWGSGWVAWSDSHWLFAKADHKDAARAEQILLKGLASPDVDDMAFLLDRLLILYEETGKDEDAERVRQQIEQMQKTTTAGRFSSDSIQVRQKHDFDQAGLPLEDLPRLAPASLPGDRTDGDPSEGKHKVGRNDPCPCGSGKKYKKCCARKAR
jgi:hypothetical protein